VTRAGVLAAALGAVACSTNSVTIAPIIDVPSNAAASPFPFTQLTMVVAHSGSDPAVSPLAQATFTTGSTIELGGVAFADDMVIHLSAGTNESAYGRTCPFSVSAGDGVVRPHLYFAHNGSMGALAGIAPLVRIGGDALTYHDGAAVLIGGADSNGTPVQDVEKYDPTINALSQVQQLQPRIGGVAALSGFGETTQVIELGGTNPAGTDPLTVEILDVDAAPAQRLHHLDDPLGDLSRAGVTATQLAAIQASDVGVVAIGGAKTATGDQTDVFVVTTSASNASTNGSIGSLASGLTVARTAHTATRLADEPESPVLVVGGRALADGAVTNRTEIFFPGSSAFVKDGPFLTHARAQHQAVRLPDNSVLIIGGVDDSGLLVPEIERYTVFDGFFHDVGMLPAGWAAVDFTATLLPSTASSAQVLITGGRAAIGGAPTSRVGKIGFSLAASATFSPQDDTPLATPRANHQATLMCNGMVMISGGTSDSQPIEIYDPGSANQR